MNFYHNVYYKLCQSRSQLKEMYGYKLGLHAHRITPGHSGGEYTDSNIAYLTPREHIIAHFLLWKINGNVNDLRSMNMLGAKLTTEQRVKIGKWCYKNKIGFHKDPKYAVEGAVASLLVQKENYEESGTKNFYYWSTEAGRKERASIGGKTSWENTKQSRGLPYFVSLNPAVRKERASKAAAATPRFPVNNGTTTKKLYSEEERIQFLSENEDYISGYAFYPRRKRSKS